VVISIFPVIEVNATCCNFLRKDLDAPDFVGRVAGMAGAEELMDYLNIKSRHENKSSNNIWGKGEQRLQASGRSVPCRHNIGTSLLVLLIRSPARH
jgi:hypothetical protein